MSVTALPAQFVLAFQLAAKLCFAVSLQQVGCRLPGLLWFHAFNRKDVAGVVEVLRKGPKYHPDRNSPTRRHEKELGIKPPRVYAYLGRTLELFGSNALVLPLDAIDGEMSPFDSGGLVKRIKPIDTFQGAQRQKYLQDYSWATGGKTRLLNVYPSGDGTKLKRYMAGKKPSGHDGPHDLWTGKEIAAIWKLNEDWRAWTWEARSAEPLDCSQLVKWTCAPSDYPHIVKELASRDFARLRALVPCYVKGGVSNLVTQLRLEQVA